MFLGYQAGENETGSGKLYIDANASGLNSAPLIYGDFYQHQIGIYTTSLTGALNVAAGTTAAGGIDFGADTYLYRAAANALKTDGLFTVGSDLPIGSGGATISRSLPATTTWDPPSIANGSGTTTTVTVTNAALGNTVNVGFSQPVPGLVLLSGAVTSTNTVTVTLLNMSGSAVDLACGTLRVDVWQH